MINWLGRLGCYLSQGLNLFLFNGSEDETVSSRIGKFKVANKGKVPLIFSYPELPFWIIYHILSRVPFLKHHFINAIEADEGEKIK